MRRKIFGRKSGEYHEASADYDETVLEKDNAYLCGCFQSERYFKDIEPKVREAYRFRNAVIPKEIQGGIENYERQIEESLSVSIHIRRGIIWMPPTYMEVSARMPIITGRFGI